MPASMKRAYVQGGDSIVDALLDVLDRAEETVREAAADALQEQQERMQQQATTDPQWSSMAADIRWWPDEDGNAAFGVPFGNERYDQAVRTEYGDTVSAPAPLIRMGVLSGVVQMGWSMRQAFYERGF